MVITRDALQLSKLCKQDKTYKELDNIMITDDGKVIAVNSKVTAVLSPLQNELYNSYSVKNNDTTTETVVLSNKEATRLLREIPENKDFPNMEQVIIESDTVKFPTKQGLSQTKIELSAQSFVDFKEILNQLYFKKRDTSKAQIVIDRKRLISALQMIDGVCGSNPSYIEITEENDFVIRTLAPKTNQELFCFVMGVLGDSPFPDLENNNFEKSLKKKKAVKRKIINE